VIATPFQARSGEEGAQAQQMAIKVLRGAGFNIVARNKKVSECGITMNVVAQDKGGEDWLFDVSGAFTSQTAGLIRTDTMWKTLGRANVLHQLKMSSRLIFLTTNLPSRGSVGYKALRIASATFFDAIEMLPKEGKERLQRYAEGGRQRPFPGFRSAREIFRDVALPVTHGASLAIPLDTIGPIPGLRLRAAGMPFHIKVVLPSVTHDDRPIQSSVRDTAVETVKSALSDAAGGCTTHDGKGSWHHPITGVQDEDVSVIESYSQSPFDPDVIGQMVQTILTTLEQHTAAVVLNDVMYHYSVDE